MYMKNVFVFILVPFILSGCTTTDPYTGEKQYSKTSVSTLIGAVSGGVIGAVASGGKAKGALIGAGVGAVGGAVAGSYLDRQADELRAELRNTGVRVVRTEKNLQLIMPGDITFKQSSADINAQFYPVLRSISKVLKKYDKTLVNINGYASSEGDPSYNQRLSEQRARSIAAYLRSQGIKKQRLIDKGFGIRYPVASNSTPEGRAANRRVTLSLTEL
jgi:outer membrane protein OmpA-like peptidoglycan-associated protein